MMSEWCHEKGELFASSGTGKILLRGELETHPLVREGGRRVFLATAISLLAYAQ